MVMAERVRKQHRHVGRQSKNAVIVATGDLAPPIDENDDRIGRFLSAGRP